MKSKLNIFYLFAVLTYFLFTAEICFGQDSMIITEDSITFSADTVKGQDEQVENENQAEDDESSGIAQIITSSKIIGALLTLLIGFYVIRILTKVLNIFSEKSASYRITLKGLIPIVRILGWTTILLFIISVILQPPIETAIAVTASVGIALGLGAQDVLRNVFGGIMILFDRPFVVGDKIEVGKYYGEVTRIGLSSTRIITPEDSTINIPNSEVLTQSVSNANSGETNCQVVADIFLPVDVDTEKVRRIALEAAQVSKYVFLNKPIVVLFINEVKQRRSYLKMSLKAYVMDIRHEFKFKSDMTEIVLKELFRQELIKKKDLE